MYTATAILHNHRVVYNGRENSAAAQFRILGLYLQPVDVTQNMSMNSTQTVRLTLRNLGDIPLTGLQYILTDNTRNNGVEGSVDSSVLPDVLNPGKSVPVPVVITAGEGAPPSTPSVFTISIVSAEGSRESATIRANLREAVSIPRITPNPLKFGVRKGEPIEKAVKISNLGYAAMTDVRLAVRDDAGDNGWITVLNGDLQNIAPGQEKTSWLHMDPPEEMMMGVYVVPLDLFYDDKSMTVYVTVEVTTATVGQVEFRIYNDAGAIVPNADVNLISKEVYLNVAPGGKETEYNNVISGRTNAAGRLLLTDIPVGEYRYLINASRHEQGKGEISAEPGTTPQEVKIILSVNLVDIEFTVTRTTIEDEYDVVLNVTYATDLVKPAIYALPSMVRLSFFPEEEYEGILTLTNTSNNAPIRNLRLDASALDQTYKEVCITFDPDAVLDKTRPCPTPIIELGELAAREKIQVPFRAYIYEDAAGTAKLISRNLGNIVATADYTFSLEGEAYESTTWTPIPVVFDKPQDLAIAPPPPIVFINDETDGDLTDLEYQGNTSRFSVKNNRPLRFQPLNPVSYKCDGLFECDPWETNFNSTSGIDKGGAVTFDIDDGIGGQTLKEVLEAELTARRSEFLSTSHFLEFSGRWEDTVDIKTWRIPISIVTIRPNRIFVEDVIYVGNQKVDWTPPPPVPLERGHGEIKIQIEQKVSLEREAFDAQLKLTPSVGLSDVHLTLDIKDAEGNDASELFQVLVLMQEGINSLSGGTVSSPAQVIWQIIPSSVAGGETPEGLRYTVKADISYKYEGQSFGKSTQEETITVMPMPKLVLDYYLPYVVMANEPVKLKVIVSNIGYGPAHNLKIASAQPKIVENLNNLPVEFALIGSSPTASGADYKSGVTDIMFNDVPAGGTAEGYWLLTSTWDGYFVEFTSTLKHRSYRGIELDSLIAEVNTHFTYAIGGHIAGFGGCSPYCGAMIELWKDGEQAGWSSVNSDGAYFISDLLPGVYELIVRDEDRVLYRRNITVVPGQPTSNINIPLLVRLAVTRTPSKTVYAAGEALDLRGMVITAEYSDDSYGEVTGYTTTPADGATLNTPGRQTVTVSYTEEGLTETDTFTVTVTADTGKQFVIVTGLRPEFQAGLFDDEFNLMREPEFQEYEEFSFEVTGEEGPFVLWIGIKDVYPGIWLADIEPGETYDISEYFYGVQVPEGVSGVGIDLGQDDWYVRNLGEGAVITLLETGGEAKLFFEYDGKPYDIDFVLDGSNPFPDIGDEEAPDLQITGYELAGSRQVGLTDFNYEFRAIVANKGGGARNVRASLVEKPDNVTVVKGDLYFGSVPAGATVESEDTFTIKINRTTVFDGSLLVFDYEYDKE